MKNDSTPLTGGPPPIGLQASITVLPPIASAPASFSASSAASPATANTTMSPNAAASAEDFDLSALVLRLPVLELGGIARSERDLVAVLKESGAQGLRDDAGADDANFHDRSPFLR